MLWHRNERKQMAPVAPTASPSAAEVTRSRFWDRCFPRKPPVTADKDEEVAWLPGDYDGPAIAPDASPETRDRLMMVIGHALESRGGKRRRPMSCSPSRSWEPDDDEEEDD